MSSSITRDAESIAADQETLANLCIPLDQAMEATSFCSPKEPSDFLRVYLFYKKNASRQEVETDYKMLDRLRNILQNYPGIKHDEALTFALPERHEAHLKKELDLVFSSKKAEKFWADHQKDKEKETASSATPDQSPQTSSLTEPASMSSPGMVSAEDTVKIITAAAPLEGHRFDPLSSKSISNFAKLACAFLDSTSELAANSQQAKSLVEQLVMTPLTDMCRWFEDLNCVEKWLKDADLEARPRELLSHMSIEQMIERLVLIYKKWHEEAKMPGFLIQGFLNGLNYHMHKTLVHATLNPQPVPPKNEAPEARIRRVWGKFTFLLMGIDVADEFRKDEIRAAKATIPSKVSDEDQKRASADFLRPYIGPMSGKGCVSMFMMEACRFLHRPMARTENTEAFLEVALKYIGADKEVELRRRWEKYVAFMESGIVATSDLSSTSAMDLDEPTLPSSQQALSLPLSGSPASHISGAAGTTGVGVAFSGDATDIGNILGTGPGGPTTYRPRQPRRSSRRLAIRTRD